MSLTDPSGFDGGCPGSWCSGSARTAGSGTGGWSTSGSTGNSGGGSTSGGGDGSNRQNGWYDFVDFFGLFTLGELLFDGSPVPNTQVDYSGFLGGLDGSYAGLDQAPDDTRTYLAGIGGSVIVLYGIEASTGAFTTCCDLNTFDVGFLFSRGDGFGFNVSGDLYGGTVLGDAFDLRGDSTNINLVTGLISTTLVTPKGQSGVPTQNGITFGYGPTVSPMAASISNSRTSVISYRIIVDATTNLLCSIFDDCL